MLDVSRWTVADLRGTRLREIVKHTMAGDAAGYDAAFETVKGAADEARARFAATFGWNPPAELGAYVEAERALAKFGESMEDFWLEELGGWMFSIALGEGEAAPLDDPMVLLAGLVQFGMDASGDTCFVSALPHPDDVAEVWVYDHEAGEISHHLGVTITDALLSAYLDEDAEPAYFAMVEGATWRRDRPDTLRADVLHRRARWLIALLWGDPGYAFERRLRDAPDFATWESERAAAAEHAHLAAYWMLAHFFLGNVASCHEAVTIGRSHGGAIAGLAEVVAAALVSARPSIGQLGPDEVSEFRQLVVENVDPAQLEPAARPTATSARTPIAAQREAMETLRPDDERLAHVIEQLAGSTDPEARGVLVLGAHRFLDNLDGLAQARTRRAANEWPSLDDLFRVDDYLIRALLHAMRPSDDLSELEVQTVKALARKTLGNTGALGTLGMAWARAMQVVAHYRMSDLVYLARGYVEAFRDSIDHGEAVELRDDVIINLAESARTCALCEPQTATPLLRSVFELCPPNRAYEADVRACMLAGLLIVAGEADDVRYWAERILGSRCEPRPLRLYGPLVGYASAPDAAARPWIWPHVWDGYSGIQATRSTIGNAAVRAMAALGVGDADLGTFDGTDWYATRLQGEAELLGALDAPHLYGAASVFERLREGEHVSDAVARRVGDWLVESLRWAEDDHERSSHRDRREALRVLLAQGDRAADQFARILALPHLGGQWQGNVRQLRADPVN